MTLWCSVMSQSHEAFQEQCFVWERGASVGAVFDLFHFYDILHTQEPLTHWRKLSNTQLTRQKADSARPGAHTKTSQAGGQGGRGGGPSCGGGEGGGQAGRGCVRHVADHCWRPWAEVYEVVFCGLTQDLMKKNWWDALSLSFHVGAEGGLGGFSGTRAKQILLWEAKERQG